ncbi:uncharacterized protein LOC105845644 [Hydra vulgaris]|uniref:uncharacterized protein LOC105845644 n=1 Tax=Hydra vulgaris TaxID=6087 RepID=UPI00064141F6
MVIIENKQKVKTVAQLPWVDLKIMILYWPPKHKVLSFYISQWSAPESNWTKFVIVKVLLESGLKSVAQDISFLSTTENETEVDSEESDSEIEEKSDKCVASPVLKRKHSMPLIQEECTFISTTENLLHTPTSSSKETNSKKLFSICPSLPRESFLINPITSTKNTCRKFKTYTYGGTAF